MLMNAKCEDLQSAFNALMHSYIDGRQGIHTLRACVPETEDLISQVVLEIMSAPVDSRTIEQVREFRRSMLLEAAKLAGRNIANMILQEKDPDERMGRFL